MLHGCDGDAAVSEHLLVSIDFPPQVGGKQTYLHEVVRRFEDMAVLVADGDGADTLDAEEDYAAYRVPRWWFIPVFPLLVLYASYVMVRERPAVIHCGQLLPGGFLGYLLTRGTDKEYAVYTFDTIDIRSPLERNWLVRWMFRRALFNADHVFAISAFAKQELIELGVDPDRITVVHPGVDTDAFQPADSPVRAEHGLEDGKVLVTVARLVERKGHDTVIRALPTLLKQHLDTTYLVVGDGPERDNLEQLAKEEGVADSVVFAGSVPHDRIVDYYNAADVFVMPSRYIPEKHKSEGFGIVFLEANACGVPVIGGDNTGMRDAVADGETGFLVDAASVDAVADAVHRLLDDDALRAEMGEAGRQRVLEQFSWDDAYRTVRDALA